MSVAFRTPHLMRSRFLLGAILLSQQAKGQGTEQKIKVFPFPLLPRILSLSLTLLPLLLQIFHLNHHHPLSCGALYL